MSNGAMCPKFPLGQVVATRGAIHELPQHEIQRALWRHHTGDWGDVGKEDWKANEEALKKQLRIVSVYKSSGGKKFYIITEWDRSVTTVLLPEEY